LLGIADDRAESICPRLERHIRQQLEFKRQPAFDARLASLGHAWRLVGAGGEMRIAPPAAPALGRDDLLPVFDQVGQHLAGVCIPDYGPKRDFDDRIRATGAGLVVGAANSTVVGDETLLVTEVNQRVQAARCDEDDIAATPAVAAIRPAPVDVFLAVEVRDSIAAFAALDVDSGFV
jgi:hypothetical protein